MEYPHRRLVVVGRFQPPHLGHVHLIEYALSLAEEVIVVIGSAQESFTLKDPLTAGERLHLLDKLLKSRLGEDYCRRVKLVPVMDINMNKVWVRYLEMLLPSFDGVVTRNPLVAELFKDSGYEVIMQPMYDRGECEGTRIRSQILEGVDSPSCIPDEIKEDLARLDFAGRLRRLSAKD